MIDLNFHGRFGKKYIPHSDFIRMVFFPYSKPDKYCLNLLYQFHFPSFNFPLSNFPFIDCRDL